MVTSPIANSLQSAVERGAVDPPEVPQWRRQWQEAGVVDSADADALFALQGRLAGRDTAFNALFWDMLCAYVLDQGELKGSISNDQGAWLQSMLDGGEGLVANAAELELLVRMIEQADNVPAPLGAFALHQIQHAAMTGEGPAAKGRIHFSRVIDAQDATAIARLLQAAKGTKRRIISRPEAEILFDMAEACTGTNDPSWDGLFVAAIQAHLFDANNPGQSPAKPAVLGPRDSAWLQSRIQHDGKVSRAERALLALIDPRQMAATSWSTPIGQML
jgi:hypothetical protein